MPCAIATWIVWDGSLFFGKPREIMRLALKERPPLLFKVESLREDAWTDYVASLRVRLNPEFLKAALKAHFVMKYEHGDTLHYEREDMAQINGFCRIETDKQFSYALIEYAVD